MKRQRTIFTAFALFFLVSFLIGFKFCGGLNLLSQTYGDVSYLLGISAYAHGTSPTGELNSFCASPLLTPGVILMLITHAVYDNMLGGTGPGSPVMYLVVVTIFLPLIGLGLGILYEFTVRDFTDDAS